VCMCVCVCTCVCVCALCEHCVSVCPSRSALKVLRTTLCLDECMTLCLDECMTLPCRFAACQPGICADRG